MNRKRESCADGQIEGIKTIEYGKRTRKDPPQKNTNHHQQQQTKQTSQQQTNKQTRTPKPNTLQVSIKASPS